MRSGLRRAVVAALLVAAASTLSGATPASACAGWPCTLIGVPCRLTGVVCVPIG